MRSPLTKGLLPLTLLVLMHAPAALADPALDKARDFLRAGRAESAISIYQEYLKQNPTSLEARLALADVALRRFDYAQARKLLETALAQHPDSAETAARLGHLFQRWSNSPAGKVADNTRDYRALANEHFQQAKALGPQNPLVLTYLADWQLQQNDLVSAEKNLNLALSLNPNLIIAYQAQGRFYMKVRDLARAKDAALHALELDPSDAASHFLVAQLLDQANRPAEAVRYAEKSEQLDYGRWPERDYFLATQYEKLGELNKAAQAYETLTTYTPREAQVWMKLGDLYESLNRPEQSMKAYQQAITLKPELLNDLLTQARENTRTERSGQALNQWRRVLALQGQNPAIHQEATSAISSLHMLRLFLQSNQPQPEAQRDLALLDRHSSGTPTDPTLSLNRLKLRIAAQGGLNPTLSAELTNLTQTNDSAVAGEAHFLLGQYRQAAERLQEVDGLSAAEYGALADRLLLIQELVYARTFYQRAYELEPIPALETAMKRIQAKQALATQRVNEGNNLYNAKDYTGAIAKYEEAARIYRQWDNIYLRLGDTYEKLKQWKNAEQAYATAIDLSPALMGSQGFAKNYTRLKKRASK